MANFIINSRGEVNGCSGIFPSSFVRIIDNFPGDRPPADADLKSYLEASRHKNNEYANTRDTFKGLEEGLQSIGQKKRIEMVQKLPQVPVEIFRDDYFR